MCVGILDRQAFRRCGSKQPRIGRHEGERCKDCSDQARAAFESGRKLEGIIRPQRVLLQQVFRPLDNACAQLYHQILAPCMAVHQQPDRPRNPWGDGAAPSRTRRQTPEITSACIICATTMVLPALGAVITSDLLV